MWHHLQVHGVDLERYSRQPNMMKTIQTEIEAGQDNIKLV